MENKTKTKIAELISKLLILLALFVLIYWMSLPFPFPTILLLGIPRLLTVISLAYLGMEGIYMAIRYSD